MWASPSTVPVCSSASETTSTFERPMQREFSIFDLLSRVHVNNLCTCRAFRSDVQSRLVKGGASGSLFFKSKCERFIIKSCTRAEMKKLRAIAPALEQHFAEHPNSLITKVLPQKLLWNII